MPGNTVRTGQEGLGHHSGRGQGTVPSSVVRFRPGRMAALDLVSLIDAVAQDGRLEEEMFLTTFLFEEAKHTEFFYRFLQEVVPETGDLTRFHSPAYRKIFYEECRRQWAAYATKIPARALVEAAVVQYGGGGSHRRERVLHLF